MCSIKTAIADVQESTHRLQLLEAEYFSSKPKVDLRKNSYLSIPEEKGLVSYSPCCGVEMDCSASFCPDCKDNTEAIWIDTTTDQEVPTWLAWSDPYEDNTYN